MIKYFPVFLDLRNRKVLLVGNGPETVDKVVQVLETGAGVRLVSSEPLPLIAELAELGKITYRQGEFEESDLDDIWLVIGTSQDVELNKRLVKATQRRKIFCNIVDVTHLCDFIAPAIVSQGDIQIAISTSGKSPALAQRLKREIAAMVGPEYGDLAELLGDCRKTVLEKIPGFEHRKALFHRLAESELLDLFQKEQRSAAKQLAADMIEETITKIVR